MNYRSAYNGLAATYRAVRAKHNQLVDKYSRLQEKCSVLSAADPQLAYYVDENHNLNKIIRELDTQLKLTRRATASAEDYAECLRKLSLKRTEELAKSERKYKVTFLIWAAVDALVLGALAYLYWV